MAEKKNNKTEKSKEVLVTAKSTVIKDQPEADSQKGQFIRKRIGKQTFLVRVYFRETGAETLQDKICRMLGDEVRSGSYT